MTARAVRFHFEQDHYAMRLACGERVFPGGCGMGTVCSLPLKCYCLLLAECSVQKRKESNDDACGNQEV
jgi:hypothetical protein